MLPFNFSGELSKIGLANNYFIAFTRIFLLTTQIYVTAERTSKRPRRANYQDSIALIVRCDKFSNGAAESVDDYGSRYENKLGIPSDLHSR